ncbi:MAG: integrase arm-type DNA-binding domain-containing protein [Xanthobacteraceae bacterium]|nr:integrase arm-type DNA-binding domain-containing protein [Xanthobacteraceae bacterium]
MARKNITDKTLKALKPAPEGRTIDLWDSVVPGLGVRVSDKGRKTFIFSARFSGAKNPTRRALGVYDALTLEKARDKAREWSDLVGKGIDPATIEQRAKEAEIAKANLTFAVVVEDFITEKLKTERNGDEVERDIRRDLIPAWGKRPITEISDVNIIAVVKAKKKTAPAQARNLLGIIKRMFGWIVDQRVYGLAASPADGLKPSKIIGEKTNRDRILNDAELFALWRAAGRLGYPHGHVYRLLTLTALRLNEAADASWTEIDLGQGIWVIPAARMKGRNGRARAHAVPITKEIEGLLEKVPRFKRGGPFVFTTTAGESPVWMSDKVKKRLDIRMLRTLKALARRRGDEAAVVMEPWTNHDIRRSVRSQLSRLRVTEEAREALLAHARPGIKSVYDHHDYLDEKREALELWAARLKEIIEPAPANVIKMFAAS